MQTLTQNAEGRCGGMNPSRSVQIAVTTGLQPGAKLREGRIINLSPTGAEFAGDITFNQWKHGMEAIKMWNDSGKIWLADFLQKGREVFGEECVQEVMSQLEFTLQDADLALAIASLPRGLRHEKLLSEHYWVLATAGLIASEQTRWAQLALDHSLSPKMLKDSIAAGKVLTSAATQARSGGVATVHAFRQTFDRWLVQVERSEPIRQWEADRKRELWAELEAPTRLGVQLARELGVSLDV